jgi:uncharacterized repeat protein (TIGR03803 family)
LVEETIMTRIELRSSVTVGLAAAACFFILLVAAVGAQAQTFQVLHTFTGAQDGANPYTGLVLDRPGNFYGTTKFGGNHGFGAVFKLSQRGIFSPLHDFSGSEGMSPIGLTVGPDGNLYGTTEFGGAGGSCGGTGCGAVFEVRPPPTACGSFLCSWSVTVLHRFTGGADGGRPYSGVIFDSAGNLYGTASQGGQLTGACAGTGCGVVYELTPSGGTWTQTVIYTFSGRSDGSSPFAGLVFDATGNLYGTTGYGGTQSDGTVFELTPSGSGWTKNTLYDFQGGSDGLYPHAALILDHSGNLYGTTLDGGDSSCFGGCGTIFQLSPSGGNWVHTVLYTFTGTSGDAYPYASLFMDAAGNLYGTTVGGADTPPYGNVYQLTPSNGGWTYSSLHDFTDGADGAHSYSTVIMDANGNLFGTASDGGSTDCASGDDSGTCGVVWEITP